jgi:lipid II:glycine glycyltransferase (peptidoglycan interpeptide bridge formation enzyme)
MVDMHYKVKGIVGMRNVWFWDGQPFKDKFASTQYHGISEEQAGKLKDIVSKITQYSAISDLTAEQEQLWSIIKKNVKYEIRRAEKEQVEAKMFSSGDITAQLLEQFELVYEQMYADKGLHGSFQREMIQRYISCGAMKISAAYVDNEPIVFHAYICDESNVRLYYSASSFRQEKEKNALFARANKFLHWSDICYFKDHGIKKYDWGGIASPDEPNGIDQFKLSFGGELISYLNVRTQEGLMGKAVKLYEEMRK